MKLKTARLFKNGQSQAVRLSKAYRFEGEKVFINKVGNAAILLSIKNPWQPLLDSLHQFSDDFMEDREQPQQQDRNDFFS